MSLQIVVFCDQEKVPASLPLLRIPSSVAALHNTLVTHTGRKAKLLSYWNYSTARYEVLSNIEQLQQPQAILSETGNQGGVSPTYHAQLWLESALLVLEPVDPVKDKSEFDDLYNHVQFWTGNKYIVFELKQAVRVQYPYLERMFDRVRAEKLSENHDKLELLYYTNNAWPTTEVLQFGFSLSDDVPSRWDSSILGITESKTVKDISGPELSAARGQSSRTNTKANPFLFSSSMLDPKEKKAPLAVAQKVLLCEVAPGRPWLSDAPLSTGSKRSPPDGYDSLYYEEDINLQDRRTKTMQYSRCMPVATQVQVSMSHQALPRYVLTVIPHKRKEYSDGHRRATSPSLPRQEVDQASVGSDRMSLLVSPVQHRDLPSPIDHSALNVSSESARHRRVRSSLKDRSVSYSHKRTSSQQLSVSRSRASPRQSRRRPVSSSGAVSTLAMGSNRNVSRGSSDGLPSRCASPQADVSSPDGWPVSQPLPPARTDNLDESKSNAHACRNVSAKHAGRSSPRRVRKVEMGAVRSQSVPTNASPLAVSRVAPLTRSPSKYTGHAPVEGFPRRPQEDFPLCVVDNGAKDPRLSMVPSGEESPKRNHQASLTAPFLRCTIHSDQINELYCGTCSKLVCPYCASVGIHRGHNIKDVDGFAVQVRNSLQELCHDLSIWLDHFKRVESQLVSERRTLMCRQKEWAHTLREKFTELRSALDERERMLCRRFSQEVPQSNPPVEEATKVCRKYESVLVPLEKQLRAYQASEAASSTPGSAPHQLLNTRMARLRFLQFAPRLIAEAQNFFRERDQAEEERLLAAVSASRESQKKTERLFHQVSVVEVHRQIERLGSAISASGKMQRSSSPNEVSSPVNTRIGSPSRQNTYEQWSTTPHWSLASPMCEESPGASVPRRVSPAKASASVTLLERCLLDLQRGHIWAIQGASQFFSPDQIKAVCSTPFRLMGLQWEIRIAPFPKPVSQTHNGSHQTASYLVDALGESTVGIAPNTERTQAAALLPQMQMECSKRRSRTLSDGKEHRDGSNSGTPPDVVLGGILRHSITSASIMNRGTAKPADQLTGADQHLGLFLFPLGHSMRMDFRVIAFSEVSWMEWNVAGWSKTFAGKGWGVFPFLSRRELMRTDKLARDNIVKVCITPISDPY